jgi:hypothetical protein
MMARMSSREFTTWKVLHDKFHMFGEVREGLRAADLIVPLLNLLLSKWVKNPKYYKPKDWIFDFWKEAEKVKSQQTPEEMKALLLAHTGLYDHKAHKPTLKKKR